MIPPVSGPCVGTLREDPPTYDASQPWRFKPESDEEAGELPKAFVVLKEELSAEDIMSYVAERVAPHKKIRRVEVIDQIPKSLSGKILHRVLVEKERADRGTAENA